MIVNQWQMMYNGLTFGASTEIQLTKILGLRGLPAIRSGDTARPRADGMLGGLDFAGTRTIDLTLTVVGSNSADLEYQLAALDAAFTQQVQTPLPLVYQTGQSQNLQVYCRPRKRTEPIDFNYQGAYYAEVTIELETLDPRIYATTSQTATVSLPVPVGGMIFPASFPLSFGGGGSPNTVVCVNGGAYTTPLYCTINGPCTNPYIINNTTGAELAFAITLGSTDYLYIDMDAHNITLNGTASRRNALVPGSTFFDLQPGSTSISFDSDDSSEVTGNLVLMWANAWI